MLTREDLSPPPFREREALRYAGHKTEDLPDGVRELLEQALTEAEGVLTFSVCYDRFPIRRTGDMLRIGEMTLRSDTAARAFAGCDEVLCFAATVGAGIDRLVRRYERLSPAKALLLQGVGAERAESLCDVFCEDFSARLAGNGKVLRPRISPGYGDLPLSLQRDIFRVLDLTRRLGLTLGEDLLMTPAKSVTAFAGIMEKDR